MSIVTGHCGSRSVLKEASASICGGLSAIYRFYTVFTVRHIVALERMQRLASRLILRAYKLVAMLVLQREARLQTVSKRLHERVSNHLTKLCSLALNHSLQPVYLMAPAARLSVP